MRATRWLLWHSDFTKFNFSRGSAPVPAKAAYDASPYPQSAGEGDTSSTSPPPRSLRRLAHRASITTCQNLPAYFVLTRCAGGVMSSVLASWWASSARSSSGWRWCGWEAARRHRRPAATDTTCTGSWTGGVTSPCLATDCCGPRLATSIIAMLSGCCGSTSTCGTCLATSFDICSPPTSPSSCPTACGNRTTDRCLCYPLYTTSAVWLSSTSVCCYRSRT